LGYHTRDEKSRHFHLQADSHSRRTLLRRPSGLEQLDQIQALRWRFDYGYMLLSIVCAMVALLVFSAAWVRVISAFGHDLGQPAGFRILNLSNLGRYVPARSGRCRDALLRQTEGDPRRTGDRFVRHLPALY